MWPGSSPAGNTCVIDQATCFNRVKNPKVNARQSTDLVELRVHHNETQRLREAAKAARGKDEVCVKCATEFFADKVIWVFSMRDDFANENRGVILIKRMGQRCRGYSR